MPVGAELGLVLLHQGQCGPGQLFLLLAQSLLDCVTFSQQADHLVLPGQLYGKVLAQKVDSIVLPLEGIHFLLVLVVESFHVDLVLAGEDIHCVADGSLQLGNLESWVTTLDGDTSHAAKAVTYSFPSWSCLHI